MSTVEILGLVALVALSGAWEHRHPMARYEVADAGFAVTRPLHAALAARPRLVFVLTLANSLAMVSCVSYWVARYLGAGVTPGFRALVAVLVVRAVAGTVTRLPRPTGWLESGVEIPPGKSAFFFVVSGHTAVLYATAVEMRLAWGWVALALLVQSARMVACRGHYSADIVVALALSVAVRAAFTNKVECFRYYGDTY
jgi:hypothetical protein